MIERLFSIASMHGDTALALAAILIVFGIIMGLTATLLIHYQERNCAWCSAQSAGDICFRHARMIRRQAAYRRAIRQAVRKQNTKPQSKQVA